MLAPISRIVKGSAGLAVVLVATAAAAAAPVQLQRLVPASGTAYRLVEGSYLVDDCRLCARPAITAPIRGTFRLVPAGHDRLFAAYWVRAFQFASASTGATYTGRGRGTYRQGGEAAIVEEMSLTLRINERMKVTLASGQVTPQARLPWIEIDLVEAPRADQVQFYRLHLVAVAWPEVWFSTELPFTSSGSRIGRVSDGDLLSVAGGVVRRNADLTLRLGIMPPAPDLGLDAVTVPPATPATSQLPSVPEIWFSVEEDAWSETLGALHHGDILSDAGRLVRTYDELARPFCPEPVIPDYGLDALSIAPDGGVLFSTEEGFFSECLSLSISPSDLLAEGGSVFRSGRDLLANFRVTSPASGDVGLDAAHVFADGEVWFSTDTAFVDERYGAIGDGDLLSDTGRVVARNLELLAAFGPVEDLADFGLDALHVVSGPAVCEASDAAGVEGALAPADSGGH